MTWSFKLKEYAIFKGNNKGNQVSQVLCILTSVQFKMYISDSFKIKGKIWAITACIFEYKNKGKWAWQPTAQECTKAMYSFQICAHLLSLSKWLELFSQESLMCTMSHHETLQNLFPKTPMDREEPKKTSVILQGVLSKVKELRIKRNGMHWGEFGSAPEEHWQNYSVEEFSEHNHHKVNIRKNIFKIPVYFSPECVWMCVCECMCVFVCARLPCTIYRLKYLNKYFKTKLIIIASASSIIYHSILHSYAWMASRPSIGHNEKMWVAPHSRFSIFQSE